MGRTKRFNEYTPVEKYSEIILRESSSKRMPDLIKKLIQAVRDEEFMLHELNQACCSGAAPFCETCPVKGTRYCP